MKTSWVWGDGSTQKALATKHEDLSLDLQRPCEKFGTVHMPLIAELVRGRPDDPLALWLASL